MDLDDDGLAGTGSSSSSKKQRRYVLQREEPHILDSSLAKYLQEEWSLRGMSPQQVQIIAKHACVDLERALAFGKSAGIEVSLPALERLGGLGAAGLYPANMHREIEKSIDCRGMPDIMPMRLPVKDKPNDRVVLDEQFILFPHMLFSALYHSFRSVFNSRLLCNPGDLEAFWDGVAHTDQYKEHPVKDRMDHRHKCIPLFLHGDGVPTTGVGKAWTRMLDVFSWGSLLAVDGKTMLTNFLIFAFWAVLSSTDPGFDTYDEYWIATCWSFEAMLTGYWPYEDHKRRKYEPYSYLGKLAGKALAGGYYAALWAKLGDLDYYAAMMKLRHYGANIPCSWCGAGETPGTPWNDFRPTAAWIATIYSAAQFAAKFPGRHRILKMRGVTINSVYPDYMHCKFLGVDMYFLGSVLTILTFMCCIPNCDSFESRLQTVWRYCLEWHNSVGTEITCRYTRLSINMFTKIDSWRRNFPRLKGRAGQVKNLVPALHYAFTKISDLADPKHKAIELALRMSHKMDSVLDRHPAEVVLPTAAAAELRGAAFVFLNQLNYLAQAYNDAGDLVFDVTIKSHMLAHIALRSGDINPRRTWCFSGERMMLHVRRLGQSCAKGIQASQIGRKMLTKYRCSLKLLFDRAAHELSNDELDAILAGGSLDDLESMEVDLVE